MGTTGAAESAFFFFLFSLLFVSLLHLYPQTSPGFGGGGLRPTFHLCCHQAVIFQPVFADRQHFREPLKGSKPAHGSHDCVPGGSVIFTCSKYNENAKKGFTYLFQSNLHERLPRESGRWSRRPRAGCRVQARLSLLFPVQIGFLFFFRSLF